MVERRRLGKSQWARNTPLRKSLRFILGKMKETAESYLGEEVHPAVIHCSCLL